MTGIRDRKIHTIYPRCSFTFDPDNFPNPQGYLSDIKRKYGVKICVWSVLLALLNLKLRLIFILPQ